MGAVVTLVKEKTDDMVSVKDAAMLLGAGYSTVNRWVYDGKIPACKVKGSKTHYIKIDDLNSFEQNGSIRKRGCKKKVRSSVEILETMSDTQQELLLEAYAATAKLLAITFDIDQIGMIKATLNNLINNDETLSSVLETAPEIIEALPKKGEN